MKLSAYIKKKSLSLFPFVLANQDLVDTLRVLETDLNIYRYRYHVRRLQVNALLKRVVQLEKMLKVQSTNARRNPRKSSRKSRS